MIEQDKAMNETQQTQETQETQETEPHPEANAVEPTSGGKKKMLLGLVLLLVLGVIAFGLYQAFKPQEVMLQGRVEADTVLVSTKLPSRIESIKVEEGQTVKAKQALAILSSPEVEAKKQQAQASLQSALAMQATAERGAQQENIDSLYANWQSVLAQANLASSSHKRASVLYKEGVISRQRLEELTAANLSANALAEAAKQQYLRAKRGSTSEQQTIADSHVSIAQAAVKETEALEAETQLFSPVDGVVANVYGHNTEFVAPGIPVVAILASKTMKVDLTVREDQYKTLYQRKQIEGYVPALDKSFVFNIKSIDAEGEFATIKNTRQSGGYDIRSFKFHLEPQTPIAELKVGMSVVFKVQQAR